MLNKHREVENIKEGRGRKMKRFDDY